jgi:hypothetical protein
MRIHTVMQSALPGQRPLACAPFIPQAQAHGSFRKYSQRAHMQPLGRVGQRPHARLVHSDAVSKGCKGAAQDAAAALNDYHSGNVILHCLDGKVLLNKF